MGKVFKFGGIPRRLCFEPSKECMKLMRSGYGPEPFGPEGQKRMAESYARWLAEKKGIAVKPGARALVCFGRVSGKLRPSAVMFYKSELVKGRYGWEERGGIEEAVRIEIPHWDWEPSCVEIGAEPMRMAA